MTMDTSSTTHIPFDLEIQFLLIFQFHAEVQFNVMSDLQSKPITNVEPAKLEDRKSSKQVHFIFQEVRFIQI